MLVAANVDLHYGAAQALRDVSLIAETGKVTALMGRNGVGKTSFLRAVVGEQPISRGTITFLGAPWVLREEAHIAIELVARSAPDGHTLVVVADSMIVINPHMYARMPVEFGLTRGKG